MLPPSLVSKTAELLPTIKPCCLSEVKPTSSSFASVGTDITDQGLYAVLGTLLQPTQIKITTAVVNIRRQNLAIKSISIFECISLMFKLKRP
ncbi:hypothetical protein DSM106972_069570 [Dulcicalothrix desertica PCC 7102]|uniref:Uncharacterized protein n=1 Tax=Dulcicalothrix desertica PCC 7102 TaxID=232991 RepID=A0A433V4G9_9CYAN|nr:hypothetical protein DSM106972_069570 [Dulcicalothrix desertica PCC 7102]